MKKILIILIATLTVIFTYPSNNFITLTEKFNGNEYIFYTDSKPEGYDNVIKNGEIYMVTVNSNEAEKTYKTLKDVNAISVRFNGSKEKINFYLETLSAEEIKNQTIDDIYIVYGYTSKIKESVDVNGQTINVQIAIHRGVVTIGSPLIIGSY
jgi:hypothetical protein